jgi:glycosyltransferase involved in cell wall biosynthesis
MVVYNDIRHLVEAGHDVFLLSVSNGHAPDPAPMKAICRTEYCYVAKPQRWRQVLRNVGDPLPYSVARYVHERLADRAIAVARQNWIDVVLIEDVAMASYGPVLRAACGLPFLIRCHNIDTAMFGRFVAEERRTALRLLGRWQLRKMRAYEASMFRTADAVSVMSEEDAAEARRLFPNVDLRVVGAGTDLNRYRPPEGPREPNVMAHVGTLSAFTKREAMVWFAREVLPRVRQSRPDVSLELVGEVPKDVFRQYPGVQVIGRVEDDVPYLHRGRVFVAPQFVGSGVRLKLLNAMATANAIVCTPLASEGLALQDGEHALICNDAERMSDAIISILGDARLAMRLGHGARRLAEQRYGWKAVVARLERALQEVAGGVPELRRRVNSPRISPRSANCGY